MHALPLETCAEKKSSLKIYFAKSNPKVVQHTAVFFLRSVFLIENIPLKFKVEMYLEKVLDGEERGIVQCFSVFWLVILKNFPSPFLLP